jgi:hypothetical protein
MAKGLGPKEMARENNDWRAHEDAHTLARAEEIRKDSKRMEAAATKAKSLFEERIQEAKSLKKIANKATKSGKKKG